MTPLPQLRTVLTPRERKFLYLYLEKSDFSGRVAYEKLTEGKTTGAAAVVGGSRYLKRIREKLPWTEVLNTVDLDDFYLARKVKEMCEAMKTEFYQGEAVTDVTDNSTRMKAIELLARLRGKDKIKLEAELSGGVQVYVPDNKRDTTQGGKE